MGDNTYGQLGYQGGNTGASTPGIIETNGVVDVAAGYDHTLYVKNDGSLWAVGYEVYGQLGDGSYGVGHNYYTNVPEMILSNGVSKVAAGQYHSLFIETNGSLWAMGNDLQWQLGNNQQVSTNTPQLIVSSNVTGIAAGWYHSVFIESDGSLWGMGYNYYGALGLGTNPVFKTPTPIDGNVATVAAGANFTLYVKNDGTLWAMGDNSEGQFGNGTTNSTITPVQVPISNVVAVAAGTYTSMFLKNDGSVWTAGYNLESALGAGFTNYYSTVPLEVVSSNVTAIAYAADALYFLQTLVFPPAQIHVLQAGTAITNGQTNAVNFGTAVTNQTGPTLTFTVTNEGGQTLDLTGISVPSGFTLDTNFPAAIGPKTSGTFMVELSNNVIGVYSGDIVVTNSDPTNGTFAFPVTGTVTNTVAAAQIGVNEGGSPITNGQITAINFGSVSFGVPAAVLNFAVTNSGGATLDLTGISVPAGFTLNTNFPTAIAGGDSGIFSIQLNSGALGTFSGNVVITNSDPTNGTFTFAVTGTVSPQAAAPAIVLGGDLNFGVIGIGFSKQSMLTISNSGSGLLTVSNIEAPSGFGVSWSNGVIAAGTTQPVTVTFSPLAANIYVGSIIVSSDAASGTPAIETSGFGANNSLVLTVLTSGSGTVTPNLNGKLLHAKTKYTLKAVPSKTSVFVGWNGSIVTNKNPLTFTMESNTIFEAIFEANPFLVYKGVFNGLFYSTNGVTEQTAGLLKNLSVASTGSYSASLLLNGATLPVHGAFSLDGQSTVVLHRSAAQGGNVTVNLQLTTSNIIPQVIGSVAGANGLAVWTASLVANLATNVIPSKELTMLIPPDTNNQPPLLSPGGDGYALITNSAGTVKNPASANVKLTGALADGTPYNESTTVASDGSVPVYANLYGGKGLLLGWINLNLTNTAAVSNEFLTWIHPEEKAGLYKSGFTNFVSSNQVMISAWTNPPANLVEFTNLSLFGSVADTNSGGDFPTDIAANGKISGSEVIGTLAVKTGLVKVTVGTGAQKVSATGALLLNNTTGGGYFLTKTNAQGLLINP
jgi:hypothetical protein